jgi:hypothetical protein
MIRLSVYVCVYGSVKAQLRLKDKELKEALSQLDDLVDKSVSFG